MSRPVRIHLIAAARPNFMKVAPVLHALRRDAPWAAPALIHVGQHYDANMSEAFFKDLDLPPPAANLGVGSGSHAEQTASALVGYEQLCAADRPDWTVVVGDVNSTLACALAAKKLGINVAHLEAGLRSGDRTMPEEINRIVTDAVSDLLWTPSADADANLRAEGIPSERIERVGNIMIDSLELVRARFEAYDPATAFGLPDSEGYAIVTLHRPATVDHPKMLCSVVQALIGVSARLGIVFPVHPRTLRNLDAFGLLPLLRSSPGIRLIEPVGYVKFMALLRRAQCAITDSGGVQEETTYLDIPCLTLRANTERPITVTQGTNRLVRIEELAAAVSSVLAGDWPRGRRPEMWDGQTAARIVRSLARQCGRTGAQRPAAAFATTGSDL